MLEIEEFDDETESVGDCILSGVSCAVSGVIEIGGAGAVIVGTGSAATGSSIFSFSRGVRFVVTDCLFSVGGVGEVNKFCTTSDFSVGFSVWVGVSNETGNSGGAEKFIVTAGDGEAATGGETAAGEAIGAEKSVTVVAG
jgi:hypothetical protein